MFFEKNCDLGVKNGMFGTVRDVSKDHLLGTLMGGKKDLAFWLSDIVFLDHCYATAIHKSQGATVDRAYVAMSLHRNQVILYAEQDDLFERFYRTRVGGQC